MLRFNKLIVRVRASLADVGKAVKGLVVMDANLDEVATGILRNTRPPFWMKALVWIRCIACEIMGRETPNRVSGRRAHSM